MAPSNGRGLEADEMAAQMYLQAESLLASYRQILLSLTGTAGALARNSPNTTFGLLRIGRPVRSRAKRRHPPKGGLRLINVPALETTLLNR